MLQSYFWLGPHFPKRISHYDFHKKSGLIDSTQGTFPPPWRPCCGGGPPRTQDGGRVYWQRARRILWLPCPGMLSGWHSKQYIYVTVKYGQLASLMVQHSTASLHGHLRGFFVPFLSFYLYLLLVQEEIYLLEWHITFNVSIKLLS